MSMRNRDNGSLKINIRINEERRSIQHLELKVGVCLEVGILATMSRNLHNPDRDSVLSVMRVVEVELNGGIIPQNPTAAATTETRRIEDENLVSTVRVNTVPAVSPGEHYVQEIESLSENINIRGLDDRWRGDNVHRFRLSNRINESEDEDYLTTFTFPPNIIVVRYIGDFRSNYTPEVQIIWNSRFSWREIKQYVEDYTYNFDFRTEIIFVTSGQEILNRNLSEEERVNNISVAVDGLPSIIITSENGDEVVCPICHDPFSSTDPAKQLPCGHLYHSECILEWFCRKNSCPTCRREPALLNIDWMF